MDKEAQGENSNSQNVKLEVTHIERGEHGETIAFGFSSGSSFFIHPELALEYSVRLGSVFSREVIDFLTMQSVVLAARDKGVEYLAAREHSSYEIILKLRKKGYDKYSSIEAAKLLREKGYLDDCRFARMWLESRLKRHPEGRAALLAGLAKKGISREVAEKIFLEEFTHEREMKSLEACIEKYNRKGSNDLSKLIRHLLRRGFKYSDVKSKIASFEETNNNLEELEDE